MADNTAQQGNDTIATDDIGGVKFQRVKVALGADGVNDGDVASANPLPVEIKAGTAAIGKLSANSGVDIGDVDVTSQPALDRLTDNIGVALQTDILLDDMTALTPKFARINATANGDNTLVAAVLGKKIRVLSLSIAVQASVSINFEDGASSGTYLSGVWKLGGAGEPAGLSLPFSPIGHFETSVNTLLNLETDAAASVGGHLVYVEV